MKSKRYILVIIITIGLLESVVSNVCAYKIPENGIGTLMVDTISLQEPNQQSEITNSVDSIKPKSHRTVIGAFNVIGSDEILVDKDEKGNIICTFGTAIGLENNNVKLSKITEAINKLCPLDVGKSISLLGLQYKENLNELQIFYSTKTKIFSRDDIVNHGTAVIQHIKLEYPRIGKEDTLESLLSVNTKIRLISLNWSEIEISPQGLKSK